jgi:hypothetical protein
MIFSIFQVIIIVICSMKLYRIQGKALDKNCEKETVWPLVRKGTIPTEQPPLVGKFSATFLSKYCRIVSATFPYGR